MNEFASPQTEWSKPRERTERTLFEIIRTDQDGYVWTSEPYRESE